MQLPFLNKPVFEPEAEEEVELVWVGDDGLSELTIAAVEGEEKHKLILSLNPLIKGLHSLRTGRYVAINFRRKHYLGNCQSKVLKLDWQHTPPLIWLDFNGKVKWEEIDPALLSLREMSRVELALPVEMFIQGEECGATTKDLGAGGLSLLCEKGFLEDTPFELKILFPGKTVKLSARVLRCVRLQMEGKRRGAPQYELAVLFEKLAVADKEFINRYIMERFASRI